MGKTLRQKIRIFDIDGRRHWIKKVFKQKLKKQSKCKTSKSKTYPFGEPNQRNFDTALRTGCP